VLPAPLQVLTARPAPALGCLLFPCMAKGQQYYDDEAGVEVRLVQVGTRGRRRQHAPPLHHWAFGIRMSLGSKLLFRG
jgi:hypothetical protein